jgi:preprotein translocase subunit SecA
MSNTRFMTTLQRLHHRLNGSTIEYDLTRYENIVHDIKSREITLKQKTDQQLKQVSQVLALHAQHDGLLDELLIEAYALVREVVGRVLHLQPFEVQIIGGIVLHQGKLAEMETGEGKTLTAVFPAYLNALTGRGVHILTFNDYLARRDAQWMGPIYQFLGLTVGYVQEGMSIAERQRAYSADLTYLTAKEAGFDFLRDSLCAQPEERVQRPFNFAIIDEADSILIDEVRIPLVIAGASDDHIPATYRLAIIARQLEYGNDVEFDDAARNVYLTDAGLERVEKLLHCDNLYAANNTDVLTRFNCALHAEFLLQRDVDYIVRHGKIELVDEFTGRIADKRRWPDGLQAALEVKENIPIQTQGTILNSITLQHFLQLYPKMCGMTATARAAEEEFRQFYHLKIVVIPPNKPCIRIDHHDVIFRTNAEKTDALIHEIISVSHTRRPILVGTRSVEESTMLAQALRNHGVTCDVLNAKNDEYEAHIVAQAGKLGAVTISTNMAGRGTDIRLGGLDEQEKTQVMALGGLYVIGTNKHESQRIDQQLRGRAGRQGDPGSSRFFISLEDDLFVKYRFQDLLPPGMVKDHQQGALDNAILRSEIDRMQRMIEGQHGEIKKTLYKYSAMIEQQRKILFEKREDFLNNSSASEFFASQAPEKFQEYTSLLGAEHVNRVCQNILCSCIDTSWSQYLADIAEIREGIHLHRIGGQDPYFEFQKLAVTRFEDLLKESEDQALRFFTTMRISNHEEPWLKTPSATWTYFINDDPFEHLHGMQLLGNIGLSLGTVWMWPLIVLSLIVKKLRKFFYKAIKNFLHKT